MRGSDPWQVTYLIDGVRQDYYTTGGNRPGFIFIDPELVKQVEARHGGGSSLYGNGGIGGTVAATTKSASDLLRPGQSFGAILKTGYTDASREWSKSAYLYGKAGIADALFAYTRRDGGKLSSSRTGRRSASPRDSQYDAILAKVKLTPSDGNKLSLSYTYDRPEQWSGPEDDRDRYDLKQHRAAVLLGIRNPARHKSYVFRVAAHAAHSKLLQEAFGLSNVFESPASKDEIEGIQPLGDLGELFERDPNLIALTGDAAACSREVFKAIRERPALQDLKAVREGRIVALPYYCRPLAWRSPEILEAWADALCD